MGWRRGIGAGFAACAVLFVLATALSLRPAALQLGDVRAQGGLAQILDRNGVPLTVSYQNRWNTSDVVELHHMPELLPRAFLIAEDRRFYEHAGVDWRARLSAVWQNIRAGRIVRGASTLTEQVVRMIDPRPRNLWQKWIEGWEAVLLERTVAKADILEFYLNQVPYAANRRGVAQAARYYFNRDLSTLDMREILTLAVLVRAPSGYDLYKDPKRIDASVMRLAKALQDSGDIDGAQAAALKDDDLRLMPPSNPVNAAHFASYVRGLSFTPAVRVRTTLDAHLQEQAQGILDARVKALAPKNLHNAAMIVADHVTGEILAWVVAGADDPRTPAGQINAVVTPRQPGSAQKPLLYGLALDHGWTPATMINDAPLSEAIGTGLHTFRNYSNVYYGPVPLREALANSLNIPALLTINHVGAQNYLDALHRMGFASLDRAADIYDEGLALGNGEVMLLEMAQGFATLAARGVYRPFHAVMDMPQAQRPRTVYSPEAASLIGNILSDPFARRFEFGSNSVLNLPHQTAVKTGTSTDYRDAWVMGYDSRYVVGIWMGNLDRTPTDGITGAAGPALALRSMFNVLTQRTPPQPLWLSPRLAQKDICIPDREGGPCRMRSEYFMAESDVDTAAPPQALQRFEIIQPTDGLRIAVDPRLPLEKQQLPFKLRGLKEGQSMTWLLDGREISAQEGAHWQVARGQYKLAARISENGATIYTTPVVHYTVR